MNSSRPALAHFLTRSLWCFFFLLLTVFTGTTAEACLGAPRIINQIATILIVMSCCVLRMPSSDGVQRRLISAFRTAWLRLPSCVLLIAVAWLLCLFWSSKKSSLPVLSSETTGFIAWNLLLCVLAYGYASNGMERIRNILTGMICGLDICIAIGAAQFIGYWSNRNRDMSFQAQHNTIVALLNDTNHFGLYLAVMLPVALWAAAHAAEHSITNNEQASEIDLRRPLFNLWRGWALIRPGLVIALGVATTSRSNWLAALCALALYFWLNRKEGRARFNPYLPGLLCGFILTLIIVVLQSEWIRFHLQQTTETTYMSSLGRGTIWRNELRMFHQHPLTGWGPGTFAINYLQFLLPNQFREPVLEGHNLYLHRLVEEGLPALMCWLGFVLSIWLAGLKRLSKKLRSDDAVLLEEGRQRGQLLIALTSMLFAYGICATFVMPEQTPTITVNFYLALAIIAALVWGAPREPEARVLRYKVVVVNGIAVLAVLGFLVHLPTLWRRDNALLDFDSAEQTKSKVERINFLREAINLNSKHPLYWARMGYAQYDLLGERGAAAAIGYYKAAVGRFPNDGVSWNNLAVLSYMTGNYDSAERCERHAILCDPTFFYYHQALATIYLKTGKPAEAQNEQALATQDTLPPIANQGLPPKISSCALPARYHRVVKPPELIELK